MTILQYFFIYSHQIEEDSLRRGRLLLILWYLLIYFSDFFHYSTRKAQTKVYAPIHTRLSIIMPMSTIRCDNPGRNKNRCAITAAIPIPSPKAAQWWVSMVVRLLLIIWPDREHHCLVSPHLSDRQENLRRRFFRIDFLQQQQQQQIFKLWSENALFY